MILLSPSDDVEESARGPHYLVHPPCPAMFIRLLALALALTPPAFAQPAPSSAQNAEAAKAGRSAQCRLHVARNGKEVLISWILPDNTEVKQFEIFRNTRDQALGRGRVAAVRTTPAIYYDSLPEEGTKYWYWLKVTFVDGVVVNVGPVATPDPDVWTP